MFSAISFGGFCREAPSTSLIIRSKKVSPGLEVIRTLISSESTRVPPVTADRSPPHSRITGADSPVIADSSTEATPSITSPSPGTNSPAVTITKSPARSCEPGTDSMLPSCFSRRAIVSARDLRNASACALPRPSAIASAKFANSTVNHSHKVIWSENPNPCVCCTHFHHKHHRILRQGARVQLHKRFPHRLHHNFLSPARFFLAARFRSHKSLKHLSRVHHQMFQNRSQAQCREKCQRAHDQHHGNQQHRKQRRRHWKSSGRFRHILLPRQASRNRQNGNHREKSPEQSRESDRGVVPEGVPVQSAERGTVISGSRSVRIQNLRQ